MATERLLYGDRSDSTLLNLASSGTLDLAGHTLTLASDVSLPNGLTLPDENILHDKIGSPALFTLHDDWITRGSAGVIDGTQTYVQADAGAGTHHIKVNAGDGYLRATNSQQGELKFIHWAAVTAQSIPAPAAGQETTRFVGIEYNAGTPQVTIRTTFNWNWFNDFPLARVSYDGTTLRILNAYAHSEDTANFTRRVLRLTHPFVREEAPEGSGGLEISDVATRQIAVTAGNIWHGFNRYILNAITAGTAFDTHYRRTGGGFNSTTGITQWPNTQYDDGSGALATMTSNRYACLWVYIDVSDNSLDVVYGRNQYTSVALAQAEGVPTTPDHLVYHGRLLGRLIFQKSASAATLVESAWTNKFTPAVISDHNLLSNLQGGAASEYYHLTAAQYSALAVGANPAVAVGLTAVNGAANTYLRSDGAPALDQSIAPTWTGLHTHNVGTTPAEAIVLTIAAPGANTLRNSHIIRLTSKSTDAGLTVYQNDWQMQNILDTVGETGSLVFSVRRDANAYVKKLWIDKDGVVHLSGTDVIFNASNANVGFLTWSVTGSNKIITLPDATGTLVLTSRTISTSGLGLSGGGDLSANRTIALASSSNPGAAASIVATDANGDLIIQGLTLVANTHALGIGPVGNESWIQNYDTSATKTFILPNTGASGGYFAMGAGTLSVASTNVVLTTPTHTHAITSSSNPGAAASLLASDSSGDLTLQHLTATTLTATGEVLAGTGLRSNGVTGFRMEMRQLTVTNNSTAQLLNVTGYGAGTMGVIFIINVEYGYPAMYWVTGGNVFTAEISDPLNGFSPTKDTAAQTNIYNSGAPSYTQYELQNKMGITCNYKIVLFVNS